MTRTVEPSSLPVQRRLYILDPIRLFAAMSVVLYHYTAMPHQTWAISGMTKFGYLGVPLFFVISGFVIALSAANRSARRFAVSRLLRLYPTYWAGMAYTIILLLVLTDQSFSVRRILANLTMLNVYFDEKNIDGVYWTLLQELKFYCCVFVLIVVGVFGRFRYWLSFWLFATYLYFFFQQPFFMGWFISPDYSAYFISGVALYLIHSHNDTRFGYLVLLLAAPLVVIKGFVLAPEFITDASTQDQYVAALIVALIVAFLTGVATGMFSLKKKSIYYIAGGLTYPLYLIHNAAGKAIMQSSDLPEIIRITIALVASLVISYMLFRFVDVGIVPKVRRKLDNLGVEPRLR